ncbi:Sugar phosphate exchanger 3 [Toxocara canis]|uniref:Sugar phosphate exchanger 3 n=1 Tax=Toxocara canis TaxID=6265 RepID=A0A0B2V0X1_TOXCA|nr:Sugar phosphate exchanger 3 [Toxocara canis]
MHSRTALAGGPAERIRERNFLARIAAFLTGGERWTRHHLTVFLLTFCSYALLHASRKTLSTVKPSLIAKWTDNSTHGVAPLFPDTDSAESFLAFLDCAFLAAYAFGLYVGGVLGDRYDPSKVLAIGMCFSSVSVFLFGTVTEWLHFYSKIFYATVWIVGALFQSVAWPTEICIMGNWFGHSSRGAVLGLWSACASVGNILGSLVSSRTVDLGYKYVFASNSLMLLVGGFFVLLLLYSAPRDLGLPDSLESRDEMNRVIEEVTERLKPIGFWRAWLLPGVISYSLAYACLKLVNYSFFFWLPYYLHNHFGWPESLADALSAWYDWGGIVAAVIAGVLSDHLLSRTPIIVSMLVFSMGALFAYANSPNSVLINSLLMVVTGFFVGGPSNLISSAVSADLGRAEEIRGSAEALSTVTGIVDGTGSIGASIGQLLLPTVQRSFGWVAVFYSFIVMMLCTFVCLMPLLCKELVDRRRYHYEVLRNEHNSSARLIDAEHEALLSSDRTLLDSDAADSVLNQQAISDVTATRRHRLLNADED